VGLTVRRQYEDPGAGPDRGRTGPGSQWVRYGQGAALVFEFTGTVGGGALLGYWVDRYLGTEPLFLIVVTITAVIGGFVRLVQVLRRMDRRR
jgi:F0F1-type ATP synthase assembly protein I